MSRVYDIVVVDVFGCGGSADPPQEFDKSPDFLVKEGAPAAPGATALGLVTVENVISVEPEKTCRGLRVHYRHSHTPRSPYTSAATGFLSLSEP